MPQSRAATPDSSRPRCTSTRCSADSSRAARTYSAEAAAALVSLRLRLRLRLTLLPPPPPNAVAAARPPLLPPYLRQTEMPSSACFSGARQSWPKRYRCATPHMKRRPNQNHKLAQSYNRLKKLTNWRLETHIVLSFYS